MARFVRRAREQRAHSLSGPRAPPPSLAPTHRAPFKVTLQLGRSTCYDNDDVDVTVSIATEHEAFVRPFHVSLVARLMHHGLRTKQTHTTVVYRHNVLPAQLRGHDIVHVPAGGLEFSVQFHVPEHVSATLSAGPWELTWAVVAVQRGGSLDYPLAVAPLTKGCLYYAIPGHQPTAQGETQGRWWRGAKHRLRVEATLASDVATPGVPLGIRVVVGGGGGEGEGPRPRKLRVDVVQTVRITAENTVLYRKEATLDRGTYDCSSWAVALVEGGAGGWVAERSLSVLLGGQRADGAATQTSVKGGREVWLLAPTVAHVHRAKGRLAITVSYHVHLTLVVTDGKDVSLLLPFSLESPPDSDNTVPLNGEISFSDPLERVKVFPLIEDPPTYDVHERMSVASYTCLRHQSRDSLFNEDLTVATLGQSQCSLNAFVGVDFVPSNKKKGGKMHDRGSGRSMGGSGEWFWTSKPADAARNEV